MKKVNLFLMLSFLGFVSCDNTDDDSSPLSKSIIQFDSTGLQFNENGGEQLVRLSLNKPALQPGFVQLRVETDQLSRFVTQPAAVNGRIDLPVSAGQSVGMLKVTPVDNAIADGNLDIKLLLLSTSSGLQLGGITQLSALLVDNDTALPTFETTASFAAFEGSIDEDNVDGQSLAIQFAKALETEGTIEISVSSQKAVYDIHFTTTPAAIDGKITLQPALGSLGISVKINPINNGIITGDMDITLTLSGTSGSIKTGENAIQVISLSDDELDNLPKGYTIGAGSWGLKKVYEYDEMGRVSKVHIEGANPGTSMRTETYFYDGQGRIARINSYPGIDKVFSWVDRRIMKSENIEFGIVKQYTDYDYDAMGNVSGTANYYRQPDGTFRMGLVITNLYFTDGNIYKSMAYAPVGDNEQLTLISTTTYDGYFDSENPFPMVEILPNQKTQTRLPSMYRVETNGHDLLYILTYEFGENGLVSKRHATSGTQVETTAYSYY